ncbi:hypothetical protein FOA32_001423 [Streptococcus sinensis]|nr:hypothetical protein [Streptococcus sinensis]
MHEAIIDRATLEDIERILNNTLVKRSNMNGEIQLLSGLIRYHLLYPFSLFLSIPMKDLKTSMYADSRNNTLKMI